MERTSEGDLVQPPCSKQAQLEQVTQGCVQSSFEFLQLRRLQQPLWAGCSIVWSPLPSHCRRLSGSLSMTFPFVNLCRLKSYCLSPFSLSCPEILCGIICSITCPRVEVRQIDLAVPRGCFFLKTGLSFALLHSSRASLSSQDLQKIVALTWHWWSPSEIVTLKWSYPMVLYVQFLEMFLNLITLCWG